MRGFFPVPGLKDLVWRFQEFDENWNDEMLEAVFRHDRGFSTASMLIVSTCS